MYIDMWLFHIWKRHCDSTELWITKYCFQTFVMMSEICCDVYCNKNAYLMSEF